MTLDASGPRRLWVAIEVAPYEQTVAFYRDALGLAQVDGWEDERSRGAVFAIGDSARIEIESADVTGPCARLAIELPDRDALGALLRRLDAEEPIATEPRGHRGCTVRDPSGTEIYLWSER